MEKILREEGWAIVSGDPVGIDYTEHEHEHEHDDICREPNPSEGVNSEWNDGYFQQFRIFPTEEMARNAIKNGECYFRIMKCTIEIKIGE